MPFLPSLYNIDKKGKTRVWSVSHNDNRVSRLYGEEDGALIETFREFSGKNINRKNETSPEEQAYQEALCEWIEHVDKGYKPRIGDDEGCDLLKKVLELKNNNGGTNGGVAQALRLQLSAPASTSSTTTTTKVTKSSENAVESFRKEEFLPMHCTTYTEEDKVLKMLNLKNGVYVQPKIDGVRAIATYDGQKVVLTSRQGKPIVHLENLKEILKRDLFSKYPSTVFDGELYAHVLYDEKNREIENDDRFNIISGACRPVRKQPHPLENQIGYYVFDVINKNDQEKRFEELDMIFEKCGNIDKRIHLVKATVVHSTAQIYELHDQYAYQNYEGVVIRAKDLRYENDHRSLKMRKYKHFSDSEYKIVGAECDNGVDSEYFVWKCENAKGESFSVKPSGTREFRQKCWEDYTKNPSQFIGKMYTVKYQSVSPSGIPRFPVGIAIRDYE